MHPNPTSTSQLSAGQAGYLVLNMKSTRDAHIGDTFYHQSTPVSMIKTFPGFRPAKSMVFSGMYPFDSNDYSRLQDALDRLTLNDASVSVSKETSTALGQGFRLGFLGTLHLDVFKQRLEEEYDSHVINTMPTVSYLVKYKDGTEKIIKNPIEFPDGQDLVNVSQLLEPIALGTLIFPSKYVGALIELCSSRRGEQVEYIFLDESRILMKYRFPMSEILTDFYDELKSRSSGYASFDYEEVGYEESDLVKVNLLLNSHKVDALSSIVHASQAENVARTWVSKLKNIMKKQLFEIVIQGAVNNRIIARETIKAVRKDVTSKCYGGDITRKMKLLERQKEGKKKLKSVAGGIQLSQEAFVSLLNGSRK